MVVQQHVAARTGAGQHLYGQVRGADFLAGLEQGAGDDAGHV